MGALGRNVTYRRGVKVDVEPASYELFAYWVGTTVGAVTAAGLTAVAPLEELDPGEDGIAGSWITVGELSTSTRLSVEFLPQRAIVIV